MLVAPAMLQHPALEHRRQLRSPYIGDAPDHVPRWPVKVLPSTAEPVIDGLVRLCGASTARA